MSTNGRRTMLKRLRESLGPVACEHVPAEHAPARAEACEECGSKVSLRVCSTCGHVGCCDSQLAHARVHFHQTGHSVMRAKTAIGSGFIWCYTDNRYVGERRADAA
jgi:CPA1 family monovalent cation:H+ antiporter